MASEYDVGRAFMEAHPIEAARVLEALPANEVAALFAVTPPVAAARVLGRMEASAGAQCLAGLESSVAATLVSELPPAGVAALARRMDEGARTALIAALAADEAQSVRRLLRYPEGTAGAVMDPRALAVSSDATAGDALARVHRSPGDMLYYLFIVDRDRQLVGVIDVRELMLAQPQQLLTEVMHHPVVSLHAAATRGVICAHPGWRYYHAMPVIDDAGVLLGAIRYQTFRRLEDEARDERLREDPGSAVFALGELYCMGLAGLLDGVASVLARKPLPDGWVSRGGEQ